MDINDISLSKPMVKLLDEVKSSLCNNIVDININDDIDYDISRIGGGASAKILSNGDWKIDICQSEPFIEYVLSHELLHVLLGVKGFPHVYMSNNFICGQFSWDIGQLLNNTVHHKIIIKEQLDRGFDIGEAQEKKLRDVADTWQIIPNLSDQTMWHIIAFTSFMIEAEDYLSEYGPKIESKNPSLYKHSKFLYDVICSTSYDNPFSTIKSLVKTFKKFDELLVANDIEPLKLFERIEVTFIPSRQQLQLNVSQVFDPRTTQNNDLLLFTKSDGQLSFVFPTNDVESLKKDISNMTVEDLFREANIKYVIRN